MRVLARNALIFSMWWTDEVKLHRLGGFRSEFSSPTLRTHQSVPYRRRTHLPSNDALVVGLPSFLFVQLDWDLIEGNMILHIVFRRDPRR